LPVAKKQAIKNKIEEDPLVEASFSRNPDSDLAGWGIERKWHPVGPE